ncbi:MULTISPECIES: GlcG/HbpS family heme-binding protein [Marinomonas]|uniref:Heme-binding protein n=1 Tax=Marinomonas rhodophyticola TaxID=2992803 RepID=A0ABT3KLL5_9GAMM|nr:heme-binding protein [Marinomonas sp. KJ51-3]MCW4631448.1 heme-binding protein [Marinomonas sp. KJ51-3]
MLNKTITKQDLATQAALQLCSAAMDQAEKCGINICITIVNSSGRTLASAAMNNAPLLSQAISHKKAFTAASFGIPTKQWQERLAERNNTLLALQSEPDFTFLGGGIPILLQGIVIGAIGVSGGSEQQDIDCATIAINTLVS